MPGKNKPQVFSCKIGTLPSLVIVCGNYTLTKGKIIKVRNDVYGSKPFRVCITDFRSSDGYFFAERI